MNQKAGQAASSVQQEPSMEEILASIRRIISDDDVSATEAAVPQEPQKAQKIAQKKEETKKTMANSQKPLQKEEEPAFNTDDLLELTDVTDYDEEILELEEIFEEPQIEQVQPEIVAKPKPTPLPVEEPILMSNPIPLPPQKEETHLVSTHVEENSLASLTQLVNVVSQTNYKVGREGITLEDITRESLKPMLKQWLDQNLSNLVEKIVREEVERLVSRIGKN